MEGLARLGTSRTRSVDSADVGIRRHAHELRDDNLEIDGCKNTRRRLLILNRAALFYGVNFGSPSSAIFSSPASIEVSSAPR